MSLDEAVREADRQLTVCNACRYCEGYCAVFPAMEKHRTFLKEDIVYMANLCFECRACYYACQFAPPHEYGINIPQALAEVRVETYSEYTGRGSFRSCCAATPRSSASSTRRLTSTR